MGVMRNVASVLKRGGRHASRRSPPAEQDLQAEIRKKIAEEQAAAMAKALHEDQARAKGEIRAVAVKEAEALPWTPPAD